MPRCTLYTPAPLVRHLRQPGDLQHPWRASPFVRHRPSSGRAPPLPPLPKCAFRISCRRSLPPFRPLAVPYCLCAHRGATMDVPPTPSPTPPPGGDVAVDENLNSRNQSGLLVSLIIGFVVLFVSLVLFDLLRRYLPAVYYWRNVYAGYTEVASDDNGRPLPSEPIPPRWPLSPIWRAMRISTSEIQEVGADGATGGWVPRPSGLSSHVGMGHLSDWVRTRWGRIGASCRRSMGVVGGRHMGTVDECGSVETAMVPFQTAVARCGQQCLRWGCGRLGGLASCAGGCSRAGLPLRRGRCARFVRETLGVVWGNVCAVHAHKVSQHTDWHQHFETHSAPWLLRGFVAVAEPLVFFLPHGTLPVSFVYRNTVWTR